MEEFRIEACSRASWLFVVFAPFAGCLQARRLLRPASPFKLFPHMKMLPRIATVLLLSLPLLTCAAPVGDFEDHADVGAPKIAGAASYDTTKQEYTLAAGGTNMWGTRDEFHFAWKKLKGDFILRARREWIGKGVDPHRKLGWIVRPSPDAEAPYVDGAQHGGDGL